MSRASAPRSPSSRSFPASASCARAAALAQPRVGVEQPPGRAEDDPDDEGEPCEKPLHVRR